MASETDLDARYEEHVITARWFLVGVWGLVAVCGVILAWLLLFPPEDSAGRWIGASTAGGVGVIFLLVLRWFGTLHIRVTDHVFSARFGPFGVDLPLDEIEEVAVEPYPWPIYTGWGLRYSTRNRRALSVPFLSPGVRVRTRDGRSIFVSSRNPSELQEAVEESRSPSSG